MRHRDVGGGGQLAGDEAPRAHDGDVVGRGGEVEEVALAVLLEEVHLRADGVRHGGHGGGAGDGEGHDEGGDIARQERSGRLQVLHALVPAAADASRRGAHGGVGWGTPVLVGLRDELVVVVEVAGRDGDLVEKEGGLVQLSVALMEVGEMSAESSFQPKRFAPL